MDGPNVYGYALQSPLKFTDRTGLKVVQVCRPLAHFGASLFRPHSHCALFIVPDSNNCHSGCEEDEDGIIDQLSLPGGRQNFDSSGTSGVYKSDRAYFLSGPNERKNNIHRVIDPRPGVTQCQFEKELRNQKEKLKLPVKYPLLGFGPNSNSMIYNAIRNSGGIPHDTGAAFYSVIFQ